MTASQEVILLQLLQALKDQNEAILHEHKADMRALLELLGGMVTKVQVIESLMIRLNAREEEGTGVPS